MVDQEKHLSESVHQPLPHDLKDQHKTWSTYNILVIQNKLEIHVAAHYRDDFLVTRKISQVCNCTDG